MNNGELIRELQKYPEGMAVCVFDGMDPSDPSEANQVEVKDDSRPLGVYGRYLFISP